MACGGCSSRDRGPSDGGAADRPPPECNPAPVELDEPETVASFPEGRLAVRAVGGDLDGDGREEVAWVDNASVLHTSARGRPSPVSPMDLSRWGRAQGLGLLSGGPQATARLVVVTTTRASGVDELHALEVRGGQWAIAGTATVAAGDGGVNDLGLTELGFVAYSSLGATFWEWQNGFRMVAELRGAQGLYGQSWLSDDEPRYLTLEVGGLLRLFGGFGRHPVELSRVELGEGFFKATMLVQGGNRELGVIEERDGVTRYSRFPIEVSSIASPTMVPFVGTVFRAIPAGGVISDPSALVMHSACCRRIWSPRGTSIFLGAERGSAAAFQLMDWDGDGRPDLLLAETASAWGRLIVHPSRGKSGLRGPQGVSAGGRVSSVELLDPFPTIAATSVERKSLLAFRYLDGLLTETASVTFDYYPLSVGAVPAGEGKYRVVVGFSDSYQIATLTWDGTNFSNPVLLDPGRGNSLYAASGVDLGAEGPALLLAYQNGVQVRWLEGGGVLDLLDLGQNPANAIADDFDGDGALDILAAGFTGGELGIGFDWQNRFASDNRRYQDRDAQYIDALGLDVDLDGLLDVVAVDYRLRTLVIYRQTSPRSFERVSEFPLDPYAFNPADLTGSGQVRPRRLLLNGDPRCPSTRLIVATENQGIFSLDLRQNPPKLTSRGETPPDAFDMVRVDVNHDGVEDVVVGVNYGSVYVVEGITRDRP